MEIMLSKNLSTYLITKTSWISFKSSTHMYFISLPLSYFMKTLRSKICALINTAAWSFKNSSKVTNNFPQPNTKTINKSNQSSCSWMKWLVKLLRTLCFYPNSNSRTMWSNRYLKRVYPHTSKRCWSKFCFPTSMI